MDNRQKQRKSWSMLKVTKNYGLDVDSCHTRFAGCRRLYEQIFSVGGHVGRRSNNVDTFYQENYSLPGPPKGMVMSAFGKSNVPSTSGWYQCSQHQLKALLKPVRRWNPMRKNRYADWIPAYVLNGLDSLQTPQMSFAKGVTCAQRVFDAGVPVFTSAYGIDPI